MLSSDLCVWRNHARIFKKCIIYRNLLKKVLQNSWKKSLFLLFFLQLNSFPQAPPAWVVRWSKGRILSKLSLFFLFLYFPFAFELAMSVPYCVKGWSISEGIFSLKKSNSQNKCAKSLLFHFSICDQLRDNDFLHFFEDETKLKIPFQVKQPLIFFNLETKI